MEEDDGQSAGEMSYLISLIKADGNESVRMRNHLLRFL